MVLVTPPEPRTLFPPLLACLPTAFVSARPPPALLPLLSPILRQRVNLLSGNTGSGAGGWLNLLSWDARRASKLASRIEGLNLEPHPVSGELELDDVETIQYRRLDEETLQSCLHVKEFDLLPVYVWCETDDAGGRADPGWRLAELRALEDVGDGGAHWYDNVSSANAAAASSQSQAAPPAAAAGATADAAPGGDDNDDDDDDDDDDDYWNSYDQTPSRTPALTPAKRSPAPAPAASNLPTASELEYFARYAAEVQPALDSHDPDEADPSTADSTLQGDSLLGTTTTTSRGADPATPTYAAPPADEGPADAPALTAPRPTSPSSVSSVDRLERGAHDMTRAEIGVKQFVSTEIKSMFRLARSVGMNRDEFERVVRTELDVLTMLEADD